MHLLYVLQANLVVEVYKVSVTLCRWLPPCHPNYKLEGTQEMVNNCKIIMKIIVKQGSKINPRSFNIVCLQDFICQ